MSQHRIPVAILCALLVSGVVFSTTPSCGRRAARSAASCCKDAATCPMHQKHASDAFGFDTCHGDGADGFVVGTPFRAVLTSGIAAPAAPRGGRALEKTIEILPSVPAIPATPPPRVG